MFIILEDLPENGTIVKYMGGNSLTVGAGTRHELFELELTDQEPTMELEGPELIERFRRASESGWKELKAMKRIGLI